MMKVVDGAKQRLMLGCYVDDLFTLYTHDGKGSLYDDFINALTHRWNVEDEGPVSDLLNEDITTDSSSVHLTQQNYIAHLVSTYLPEGVPLSFHKARAPASETLPMLIEQALLTKPERANLNKETTPRRMGDSPATGDNRHNFYRIGKNRTAENIDQILRELVPNMNSQTQNMMITPAKSIQKRISSWSKQQLNQSREYEK
eukprot:886604-Pleurochrysis_carterae.AAC.3